MYYQYLNVYFSKKIFFLITIFQSTFSSFGQIESNKIIDSGNGTPLSNVIVINTKTQDSVVTNLNGYFKILNSGNFLIKKRGYQEKVVELKHDVYNIIQLSINPSELNEIIINSKHLPKKLKRATASIHIVSSKDINRSNHINFNNTLNRVPGVFMQSGALNTNRITIRGIGSRNLFGTAKIRAYFKDIPLTNGTGETSIEDFELTSISRIEIIKGATSSIYGAGLGGTINIIPENALLNQSSLNTELSIGSFGLIKGSINANFGAKKNSFKVVYSNTHSDGYRENNEYNRQNFNLLSNHFLSKKDELSFLLSYIDLKAFIPSSINENSYLNSPKSAAFTWKQAQGYEDSKHGVFGVSWNHQYSNKLKQITSIFTSFRNSYEPRPFNILEENTTAFGIRSRLLSYSKVFNKNLNWTLGLELFKDNYKSRTFDNLYETIPIGSGSIEGDKLSDFKEKRNYYNAFFEANYEVSKKTTITIGLNLNETAYDLKDRFPFSESNVDQSGKFKFKSVISPKLGISYLFSKSSSFFTSISHGFSPISLNDTLLPDGQINTNLKPETGWNFEIGSRNSLFNDRLQLNVALYRLDIKNLLVSRRTALDQFIGINAGRTQHDGLEFAMNYKLIQKTSFLLSTFINYTLNDFTFKTFIDDQDNFSGNKLTGVPSNIINGGIDLDSKFGVYGNINFQHVGSMPMTDSNSLYSDSYNLTNIKFGYQANLNKKLKLNIFFGLNNIFDEAYASQILINASSFGGNAPRYYYPGEPINYYSGVNLNYVF